MTSGAKLERVGQASGRRRAVEDPVCRAPRRAARPRAIVADFGTSLWPAVLDLERRLRGSTFAAPSCSCRPRIRPRWRPGPVSARRPVAEPPLPGPRRAPSPMNRTHVMPSCDGSTPWSTCIRDADDGAPLHRGPATRPRRPFGYLPVIVGSHELSSRHRTDANQVPGSAGPGARRHHWRRGVPERPAVSWPADRPPTDRRVPRAAAAFFTPSATKVPQRRSARSRSDGIEPGLMAGSRMRRPARRGTSIEARRCLSWRSSPGWCPALHLHGGLRAADRVPARG